MNKRNNLVRSNCSNFTYAASNARSSGVSYVGDWGIDITAYCPKALPEDGWAKIYPFLCIW